MEEMEGRMRGMERIHKRRLMMEVRRPAARGAVELEG